MTATLPPLTAEEKREALAAEEWLFAQYPQLLPASNPYSGYDALLWDRFDWWTVGIKWSHRGGARLIRRANESLWCDIYVLVTGTYGHFRVAGWAWGIDLRKHWVDKDLPVPGYAMRQTQIRAPLEDLLSDFAALP